MVKKKTTHNKNNSCLTELHNPYSGTHTHTHSAQSERPYVKPIYCGAALGNEVWWHCCDLANLLIQRWSLWKSHCITVFPLGELLAITEPPLMLQTDRYWLSRVMTEHAEELQRGCSTWSGCKAIQDHEKLSHEEQRPLSGPNTTLTVLISIQVKELYYLYYSTFIRPFQSC